MNFVEKERKSDHQTRFPNKSVNNCSSHENYTYEKYLFLKKKDKPIDDKCNWEGPGSLEPTTL